MTNPETQQRVCEAIQGMKHEIVDTLQDLVRIPSVVGDEAAAQDFMEGLYRDLELVTNRFYPDITRVRGHRAFIETGMSYENRPNLIAILPGQVGNPSLILNGHVDVVSPEPMSAWTHDPWGGEVEGERLYGRGSGDMKAGLLANYFALKGLIKVGIRPKGTVMLQSVVDEEAGGAGGTLSCLMAGYTADAMIATEPHNLNITIGHAGINYFRVKVMGKTSHAGLAHLGVNAIGKIIPIYQALMELDEQRGMGIHFPLFEKGSGRSCHINIGTIKGGDWPSSVAGSVEMECRIGFVPGEEMEDIKRMIEETVRKVARKDSWLKEHPPVVKWFGWQADPWYQDPEDPFVQMFKSTTECVCGHEIEFIGRAGGNDCRFSQYFDMPAALTGPKAENIHGIDEYVEIPTVIQTAQVLAMTALRWCGYLDSAS